MKFTHTKIPLMAPVQSLSWLDDSLIDWAGGCAKYHLDGSSARSQIAWGYGFDAAAQSSSGRFAVIYKKLGTKALLLDGPKIIRELNRSFYCAEAYEYPVVLFTGPDGRELIAHCPDEYCQLEIEDLLTGTRLTASKDRKPADFFHSRLAVSPGSRRLLSAGWVWHPLDCISVYDLQAALTDAKTLDPAEALGVKIDCEVNAAAFTTGGALVLAANSEADDFENEGASNLKPGQIGRWCFETGTFLSVCSYQGKTGALMPLGEDHVVSFFGHPKLIDLSTGLIVQEWPEIESGHQSSSIIGKDVRFPSMAFDIAKRRFAVASEKLIHVIECIPRSQPPSSKATASLLA
ncbi:MAG: hypothetical protein Q8M07_27330 [Prosthecobacter sp.]|nr:hypothetical protein [Prosthecobacter sp.]